MKGGKDLRWGEGEEILVGQSWQKIFKGRRGARGTDLGAGKGKGGGRGGERIFGGDKGGNDQGEGGKILGGEGGKRSYGGKGDLRRAKGKKIF